MNERKAPGSYSVEFNLRGQASNARFHLFNPGDFNMRFEVASNGYLHWTDSTRLTVTAVKEEEAFPVTYSFAQNYPNPFNPSTTIKYELPKTPHVTLTVSDILGREVFLLVNEKKDAGVHEVKCDGSNLSRGVYFYRLQAGDFAQSKKLVLLK